MNKKALDVIQSIVGTDLYLVEAEGKKKPRIKPGKPLVTISRFYGTPDKETAQLLAKRMDVPLYDKELLNAISKQAKGDKHLLESLDERVTSLVDDMVHAFFSKKSTNKDAYFRYMAKVIVGIGPSGGVIVGRAAHLLLPKRAAFRVRLEGSLKVCSKRLITAERSKETNGEKTKKASIKKASVEKEILKVNKEWEKFNRDVAKRFPSGARDCDLVINSDIYTPEQMVRIITTAMQEAGFQVPEK